jgi:hypothetical protein
MKGSHMALTTVAELRSTLGVGTLYPDATLQEVADAADAVLLPMLWQNELYNTHQTISGNVATLYFNQNILEHFYVGQSVTITRNGSPYNGTKTITAISSNSISYSATGADQGTHAIQPFGIVADSPTDYATDTAVQQAALMISVEIWQARTATLSGSNAVDFQPSPYRMSAQLLAKVRGLIAHCLSPNSMVG